jgi:hypothetical protein
VSLGHFHCGPDHFTVVECDSEDCCQSFEFDAVDSESMDISSTYSPTSLYPRFSKRAMISPVRNTTILCS